MEDYLVEKQVVKKLYPAKRSLEKIVDLAEYYKFHKEIPRIFSKNEFDIYFEYHDRKRKVEYVEIMNCLKLENGEDPYKERRVELLQKRKVKYIPLLNSLPPSHLDTPL